MGQLRKFWRAGPHLYRSSEVSSTRRRRGGRARGHTADAASSLMGPPQRSPKALPGNESSSELGIF
eukprot:3222510-Alexandrium_andersonii.AAC.1